MPSRRLDRRAFLALAGLAPLAGCAGLGEPPLPWARLRSIDLDVSPLAEKGLPRYAEEVAAIGRPLLAQAFADALAPADAKAPRATVTIDEIRFAGSFGRTGGPLGWEDRDRLSGRLVVAPVGAAAISRRLFADRPPSDAGPWYLPDIDRRRLEGLLRVYVAWARREFSN